MNFTHAIKQLQTADATLNASQPKPFPVPVAGLEAVVAGTVLGLERGDWWVPGLRERVGAVLRDAPVERLINASSGAKPYKVAPADTTPALRALTAVGLAAANPERCAAVHLGIGSVADGAFHEALNLAALQQVNVVFVVAVHPLDGDAPLARQSAASPSALAAAYGIHTTQVDGSSARDVHAAVTAARTRTGPHLIEAQLTPGTDLLARATAEA